VDFMPILAEFEEREYEYPLYFELSHDSGNIWSPGQVLEGHFGFDAAIEVTRISFLASLGLPFSYEGCCTK
jgi:hypothetical protein